MVARNESYLGNLSRRERQIMEALFQRGEASVADVRADIATPPSYSAVRATLRVLEEKGRVRHRESDGRYLYEPVIAPERARAAALTHLVRTFFDGSPADAAVALLRMSDTRLSPTTLDELAAAIDSAEQEGR
ncbi:MAG TPA: BlaI/MecI/CopY family transcriptional regulator [Longimicrobiales bacterium]|nr:BlaI/MecI/CopY family transcriptional regulator [Longimicrobiales bacterium]